MPQTQFPLSQSSLRPGLITETSQDSCRMSTFIDFDHETEDQPPEDAASLPSSGASPNLASLALSEEARKELLVEVSPQPRTSLNSSWPLSLLAHTADLFLPDHEADLTTESGSSPHTPATRVVQGTNEPNPNAICTTTQAQPARPVA